MITITLNSKHYRALGLPDSLLYVKAAFFLGMPYHYIAARAKEAGYAEERSDVVATAVKLGFDADRSVRPSFQIEE